MSSKTLKGPVLASILFLVSASVGVVMAITTYLPARFGGLLSGTDVVRDFLLFNGTALSPDLALMLGQVALTVCAIRRGRAGFVGVVGLTILGAGYTVGQLGEPVTLVSLTPATFSAAPATVALVNLASSLLMVAFGVREWRSRSHSSRVAVRSRRLAGEAG